MSPAAQLLLEEHRGVSGVGGALVQSSSVYSREPLIPFSLPLSPPPPLGPPETPHLFSCPSPCFLRERFKTLTPPTHPHPFRLSSSSRLHQE